MDVARGDGVALHSVCARAADDVVVYVTDSKAVSGDAEDHIRPREVIWTSATPS